MLVKENGSKLQTSEGESHEMCGGFNYVGSFMILFILMIGFRIPPSFAWHDPFI